MVHDQQGVSQRSECQGPIERSTFFESRGSVEPFLDVYHQNFPTLEQTFQNHGSPTRSRCKWDLLDRDNAETMQQSPKA